MIEKALLLINTGHNLYSLARFRAISTWFFRVEGTQYPLPIKVLYSVVSSDTKTRRSMMTLQEINKKTLILSR